MTPAHAWILGNTTYDHMYTMWRNIYIYMHNTGHPCWRDFHCVLSSFDGQGPMLSPVFHNSSTLLPREISFFHLILWKRVILKQLKSLMMWVASVTVAFIVSLAVAIGAPLLLLHFVHLGLGYFSMTSGWINSTPGVIGCHRFRARGVWWLCWNTNIRAGTIGNSTIRSLTIKLLCIHKTTSTTSCPSHSM